MSAYRSADATVSAVGAAAITTSDSATIPTTRGIYIGGSGDIKVDMADSGTGITFVGISAGVLLPLQVTRVYATGTTATNLVAVY